MNEGDVDDVGDEMLAPTIAVARDYGKDVLGGARQDLAVRILLLPVFVEALDLGRSWRMVGVLPVNHCNVLLDTHSFSSEPDLPNGFYDDMPQVFAGQPSASFRKLFLVIGPVPAHLFIELLP